APSPVVKYQAEATARMICGREIACRRIETEIESADIGGPMRLPRRKNLAAITTIDSVDAIIQSPAKPIHVAIAHAQNETGEHNLSNIRLPISIGVLKKKDVRRRSDEDSTVPRRDRRWEAKALGKQCAAVDFPIVIGVFQQADRATRFALRAEAVGIIAHLDHIHPPFFVPC